MTGETGHNLRGDYSRMKPDYTVDQEWQGYTPEQHELWRRLYARQAALIPASGLPSSLNPAPLV